MNRLILITTLALAAAAVGCDKRGQGPNPPTPQTQHELSVVMAETPAADPSLPVAAEALAKADAPRDAPLR